MTRDSVAASVAKNKLLYPEKYCRETDCLWALRTECRCYDFQTTGTCKHTAGCPKHGKTKKQRSERASKASNARWAKKPTTLKTAILVDPMGSSMGTPEEEIEKHIETYGKALMPVKLKTYAINHPLEIKLGTKLVIFDFGGMIGGNDLLQDNSRAVIEWALDNPQALVIVASSFTYQHGIGPEIRELGMEAVDNIVAEDWQVDDIIPDWFRKQIGAPYIDPSAKKKTVRAPKR